MKGIVFTEFLEMVEDRFGLGMVDRIIEAAELPGGGAYTAVGTYECKELVRLVACLSQATGTPMPELIQAFGRHLFGRFQRAFPALFAGIATAFDFLRGVEHYIHVEVRKLYPDAELPSFSYEDAGPHQLVMVYQSRRPFADLADGLIQACIAHYGVPIALEREDLERGAMNRTRFTLTQNP